MKSKLLWVSQHNDIQGLSLSLSFTDVYDGAMEVLQGRRQRRWPFNGIELHGWATTLVLTLDERARCSISAGQYYEKLP